VSVLRRFENRLEQLVSGVFARAFRSEVQPVEVAAALQREVDNSAQILSRDRRLAPNTFRVELSPADHDRLAPYGSTLAGELSGMLHEHADQQSYVFTGPLSISFDRTDDLSTGRFRVSSAAMAPVVSAPESHPADPEVRRSSLVLEVNGAHYPLQARALVIGRGSEADLRIDDPGVSRRHAEVRLDAQQGWPQASIVDLGSTNGLLVDGRRVESAVLHDGATVTIGNTTITLRDLGVSGRPHV
jgi:hypothetical protein